MGLLQFYRVTHQGSIRAPDTALELSASGRKWLPSTQNPEAGQEGLGSKLKANELH